MSDLEVFRCERTTQPSTYAESQDDASSRGVFWDVDGIDGLGKHRAVVIDVCHLHQQCDGGPARVHRSIWRLHDQIVPAPSLSVQRNGSEDAARGVYDEQRHKGEQTVPDLTVEPGIRIGGLKTETCTHEFVMCRVLFSNFSYLNHLILVCIPQVSLPMSH